MVLAPIGSSQLFDDQGAAGVARAAEQFGTLQFVSSHSEPGFEEVAAAGSGPKVFQLYLLGDEEWMNEHIDRAIEAGYTAFCLTVDTQVPSRRERDWLKRWQIPSISMMKDGLDFGYQAKMTWQTVERYKKRYQLPLVVKGIATAADARRACDLGVDVVYVTNHGGRQLDHGLGGADMLPEIVQAVAGETRIVADGGVLRGTDVVKMVALGADAVGIGRLYCLGMAAGGTAGVVRVLQILRHEIKVSLALLGVCSFAELDGSFVVPAPPAQLRAPETHLSRAFPFLDFEHTRF